MLSAERLERILRCPCGWRGGPVACEAPTRYGAQLDTLREQRKEARRLELGSQGLTILASSGHVRSRVNQVL